MDELEAVLALEWLGKNNGQSLLGLWNFDSMGMFRFLLAVLELAATY